MVNLFNKLFLFIFCIISSNLYFSQNSEKRHFIILIDASASIKGADQQNVLTILKGLPNKLKLSNTDYVSLIPFGISNSNPNFDAHYRINQSVLMQKYRPDEYNGFLNTINSSFFSADWTGLSIVLPRSLYLFDKKKSKVTETDFVIITDGVYNAINPIDEINNLANNGIKGVENAKQQINQFNRFFYASDKEESKVGNISVLIKKLIPSGVEYVDINSLAEINNLKSGKIEVGRTLNGYVLDFNLKDKPNIFKILNIDFVNMMKIIFYLFCANDCINKII